MKFPTMSVGIPYGSRLIVNEKQQLMKPSSFGGWCCSLPRAGVAPPFEGSSGLYRSTHDVRTAFWFESNATLPYFCARMPDKVSAAGHYDTAETAGAPPSSSPRSPPP